MHLKTILKGTICAFFTSLSLASYIDDCEEIYNKINDSENIITGCEINDFDEVTSIEIYNNGKITKNDLNLIFSFNSINDFTFMEEKGNCSLLKGISKLNNLNSMTIQSYKGYIDNYVLKELTFVKKLNFINSNISEENIEVIASLPNLEELSFFKPGFNKNITFATLKNNKNITSVKIQGSNDDTVLTYDLIKNLRNVKKLTIKNMVLTQEQFNEITTLSNLEQLSLIFFNGKKEFKVKSFDSVENLTHLSVLEFSSNLKSIPEFVYKIPNLKKFIFNNRSVKL
ncbi:hypothetical protein H8356DRAFT_1296171 [Neocallimastix lanati (nom. inval.)]|jgi:hypothetical protein|uniref:RNI-like protein n=1 Tax=Neocallimastix californiae TaxID=1754190 RepID=A0A1Y2AXU6_9FUNG|nr:hypothetical protein H8356DRAFT_1296171 [Neocallimastix sp. JGI-2020a]ORY27409.1 hypothetical protein LY90DRAFT_96050 [Neocallimastix californiae]|eukprot:ORY27409.1 hypothetical protein LY90DRAFT_96050 [Neocallimastix californiae]